MTFSVHSGSSTPHGTVSDSLIPRSNTGINHLTVTSDSAGTTYIDMSAMWKPGMNFGIAVQASLGLSVVVSGTLTPYNMVSAANDANIPWDAAGTCSAGSIVTSDLKLYTSLKLVFSGAGVCYIATF